MKIINLSLVIIMMMLTSCNLSEEEDVNCVTPPSQLLFKIVNEDIPSQNLITEGLFIKDSIKLWYQIESKKIYVNISFVTINSSENIIQTNAPYFAINEEPTNFYLYLNKDDIDTLKLKLVQHFDVDCSYFSMDLIEFNGKVPDFEESDYTYLHKKKIED